MPKFLTINSLKGGTAKSTLTLNLFYYYQSTGLNCGIIDGDLQGSLTDLATKKELPLISRGDFDNWDEITNISDMDMVLIDTGPYMVEQETVEIFRISNFVLMPVKASIFDIQALNATIEQYDLAATTNADLKAAIILTQGIHSTGLNEELRNEVKNYSLPVLATEMRNRVDYARSLGADQGIFSTENSKAIQEIKTIGVEIQNLMSHGRR